MRNDQYIVEIEKICKNLSNIITKLDYIMDDEYHKLLRTIDDSIQNMSHIDIINMFMISFITEFKELNTSNMTFPSISDCILSINSPVKMELIDSILQYKIKNNNNTDANPMKMDDKNMDDKNSFHSSIQSINEFLRILFKDVVIPTRTVSEKTIKQQFLLSMLAFIFVGMFIIIIYNICITRIKILNTLKEQYKQESILPKAMTTNGQKPSTMLKVQ